MTAVKPASDATYKMKVILVGMINGPHDHDVYSRTKLIFEEKILLARVIKSQRNLVHTRWTFYL